MQWYAAIVGLLLSCSLGCSTPSVPRSFPSEPSRDAIIVVTGYYGTKLARVDNGDLVWVTASQALGGSQSLILPLADLGFHGVAVRPSGILDAVSVIPWLYSIEFYRPLLDQLHELRDGHLSITSLNYDWRLDLMDAVHLLSAEVRRLRSSGHRHIAIVAHSMGGLIVSYYLRYGAQDLDTAVETWDGAEHVDRVVMAGVPFQGSMWSFRNMQYGKRIGLNRSLLDQQAMASFPSSYFTLPVLGEDVLLTDAKQPIRGMIHSTPQWREQGWGLLKNAQSASTLLVAKRETYTAYWLNRSQRFFDLLHAPSAIPNDRSIPVLYLYGEGQPTLAGGVWIPEERGRQQSTVVFDEDQFTTRLPDLAPDLVQADGDGTVTVRSALLPSAYEKAFHVTTRRLRVEHMELVTGREGRCRIAEFFEPQRRAVCTSQ